MKIVKRLRDEAATLNKAASTIERLMRERLLIRDAAAAEAAKVQDALAQVQSRMDWAIREIERLRAENDELADFCLRLVQAHGMLPKA